MNIDNIKHKNQKIITNSKRALNVIQVTQVIYMLLLIVSMSISESNGEALLTSLVLMMFTLFYFCFCSILRRTLTMIHNQIEYYDAQQLEQHKLCFMTYKSLLISIANIPKYYPFRVLICMMAYGGLVLVIYAIAKTFELGFEDYLESFNWKFSLSILIVYIAVVFILVFYYCVCSVQNEYKLNRFVIARTQKETIKFCYLVLGYYILKIILLIILAALSELHQLIVCLVFLLYCAIMLCIQVMLIVLIKQPLLETVQNQCCFECYFTLYKSMFFSNRPAIKTFRVLLGILILLCFLLQNILQPITSFDEYYEQSAYGISQYLVTDQMLFQIYIVYLIIQYLIMVVNKQQIVTYSFDQRQQIGEHNAIELPNPVVRNEIIHRVVQNPHNYNNTGYEGEDIQIQAAMLQQIEEQQRRHQQMQPPQPRVVVNRPLAHINNRPIPPPVFSDINDHDDPDEIQLQLALQQIFSQQQLQRLHQVRSRIGPSQQFECCICTDALDGRTAQITLKCHRLHTFHKACIQQWLSQQRVCPLCKKPV